MREQDKDVPYLETTEHCLCLAFLLVSLKQEKHNSI